MTVSWSWFWLWISTWLCVSCVSVQVLSALDILQPPQIDCFEEMYPYLCVSYTSISISVSLALKRREATVTANRLFP